MTARAASIEKRRRTCAICATAFVVKRSYYTGRTCSLPCRKRHMAQLKRGTKQSPETIAKRAEAMRKVWQDPDARERRLAAHQAAITEWHSDPENAAKFAQRQSERMKRLHADPEFQARRDVRSAETMKATWEARREHMIAVAQENYQRMAAKGTGLCAEDTIARKNAAAKWIMTKASEALRLETDYNEVYGEVQARLRREMPYDGPQDGSEYMDYLQKLGRAVVSSPECRSIADPFMSEAIPRFSQEWQRRKRR